MAVGRMFYALSVMLLATGIFADNAVGFGGNIQVATCDVRVNGGADTPTVLVPEVSIVTVQNNIFSAPTAFTISVYNCPVGAPGGDLISVFFSSPSDGDDVTMANLGTATGVGFAISSHTWSSAFYEIGGKIAEVMPIEISPGKTSGSAEYHVGYMKKSHTYTEGDNPQLRPGTVRSVMEYAIVYF